MNSPEEYACLRLRQSAARPHDMRVEVVQESTSLAVFRHNVGEVTRMEKLV